LRGNRYDTHHIDRDPHRAGREDAKTTTKKSGKEKNRKNQVPKTKTGGIGDKKEMGVTKGIGKMALCRTTKSGAERKN